MLLKSFMVFSAFSLVGGQDLNFDDCGKSFGCVKRPTDCTSFADCTQVGMYFYNKTDNMFHFQLTFRTIGNNKWAALAQNTKVINGDRMTDLRGFYCAEVGSAINLGFLMGTKAGERPNFFEPAMITEVKDIMTKTDQGIHKCSFKRPMTITSTDGKKVLYNLDQQVELINVMSNGPINDQDGMPVQHAIGNYNVYAANAVTWKEFTLPEEVMMSMQPTPSMKMMDSTSMMSMSKVVDPPVTVTPSPAMTQMPMSSAVVGNEPSTTPKTTDGSMIKANALLVSVVLVVFSMLMLR